MAKETSRRRPARGGPRSSTRRRSGGSRKQGKVLRSAKVRTGDTCPSVDEPSNALRTLDVCDSTDSEDSRLIQEVKKNEFLLEQNKGLQEKISFLNKWRTHDPADSGDADVKIIAADGMVCRAHRLIVESRSDVFHQMLTTGHENYLGESPMMSMDISSASVRLFLSFLYSAEVSMEDLKNHSMELMWASQKYQVPTLRMLCEEFNITFLGQLKLGNALRGFELASKDVDFKHMEKAALQSIFGEKDLSSSPEFEELKARDLNSACRLLQELYAWSLLKEPSSRGGVKTEIS